MDRSYTKSSEEMNSYTIRGKPLVLPCRRTLRLDSDVKVDDFACPARFSWHTAKNVTRDPAPEFLCLVGLSRHYTLDEETYPLFLDMDGEEYIPTVSINVLAADVYTTKKFATVEDFALLHEDKIYSESKTQTAKDKGLASEVSSSTKKKERTVAITTEDMQKRKNDVKARTTLLLALPDEHHHQKTKKNQLKQQYGNFKAKGSETLEQTFNRLQAIISHLEFMDVPIKEDDFNQNFLTSLAPEWLVYTIVWRNRDDLDTMSLDDVYNHLKVYEPEVQKRAGSNSQNMAFISSSNTSSGKSEVPTVQGASTASAQIPTVSTDVTGKNITIQGSNVAGFDKSKVECFNFHKMGHFARECRSPKSQDIGKRESYKKDPKVEEPKAMIAIDGIRWDWSYIVEEDEALKNHALIADEEEVPTEYALMVKSSLSSYNEVKKEKENIDFKIENFENDSKDLDRLVGSQKLDKDMKGVGFNEYCAVPPPLTQVYSPPKKDLSRMRLPEFVDDTVTDYTRPTPSIDVLKSDSGCSRHMTGNISYLSEYEPFNGGYVSFGHGRGKITGKGSIKTEIENLKDLNVKIIRSDNGGEFRNKEMDEFSSKKGIKREFSNARIPQQNGVAKKRNRTLIEAARTMLADAKLPVTFWAEAVNTACYVQNREVRSSDFKTMNKLVRSNLAKGLPSKSFENDHSCVACLKGKQHKASYTWDDLVGAIQGTGPTTVEGTQSMDASDAARSGAIALRNQVSAHRTEIADLRAADRRFQTKVGTQQDEIRELRAAHRKLQAQFIRKMAPKRTTRANPATTTTTTTISVIDAQLEVLIEQGVAKVLVARDDDRNTNGNDSHVSGTSARKTERVTRECTYPDFMKCKPLNFKGT
nr:putative ribonuclease H-like domain-containing protein [Tanacetum cinerariifolium]